MQGVRPLPPGPRRAVPEWQEKESAPSSLRPRPPREPLHVDGEGKNLSAAAFGVAHDLVRSLARGEIEPEAESDLHRLTAEVAAHQAERFIEQSVAKGRRCVLLIHGRGLHSGPSGPALRSAFGRVPLPPAAGQARTGFHLCPAPSRRHRRANRASATSLIEVAS